MKTLSFWKKSIYSGLVFFGTVIVLSVGYAVLSSGLSNADKVGSGSGLTSTAWNRIVSSILELDTRTTNIFTSGENTGIGISSPTDVLTVSGGVTATKFTASTTWTAVPGNATWSSDVTCRRIGSLLQIKGQFVTANSTNTSGWPVANLPNLPSNCWPTVSIYYIPGIFFSLTSITSAGPVQISTSGVLSAYNNLFYVFSFAGTYPVD